MTRKRRKKSINIFGENLKSIRKTRNVTCCYIANLCKVDRGFLGGVEKGEYNISTHYIMKICMLLGISIKDLLKPLSKRELQKIAFQINMKKEAEISEEDLEKEGKKLGESLSAIRRKKHYTQLEVAKKIGISRGYLSQIEKGKSVSLEVIDSLMELYERNFWDIF